MRLRAARIVVVAIALGSPLASCSDGALSKEEFIAQADAICKQADEQTETLATPTSPAEAGGFVEKAQEITGESVRKIRELEPPAGDEDTIETMLNKVEEALAYLPTMAEAAQAKDLKTLQEAGRQLQATAGEAQKIARDYGFEVCGGVGAADAGPTR
ncbi:MAG: hypothetical protein M3345_02130 [Actinomycetota bacterium]|nr:hypothetical protein [Actinomycetota bacterium]